MTNIIKFPVKRTWAYIEKKQGFSAIDFARRRFRGEAELLSEFMQVVHAFNRDLDEALAVREVEKIIWPE